MQVVILQKYLWGGGIEENIEYFKWKYKENPFAEHTLGTIVLYENKLVGFSHYCPSRWEINSKNNNIMLLSPTDIIIHPKHRRKGLFSAIAKLAIKKFENTQYRAFINLSANKLAAAANLKLGWRPINNSGFFRYYNFLGLVNYILIAKTNLKKDQFKINLGRFGDIEVTDKVRAEEMSSIINKNKQNFLSKIKLYKDKDYFEYKFRNPRYQYLFYYFLRSEEIKGYVVIKKLKESNNVHIFDYAQSESKAIKKIISYMISNKHFEIISIWDINLENGILKTLKDLDFHSNSLINKIERKFRDPTHVLVRPIKEECTEKDWLLYGVDIRNINNWVINEFCSDTG